MIPKRRICADDFIYHIIIDKRIPKIIKRRISKIVNSNDFTQNIYFNEPSKKDISNIESRIVYYYRGLNWTEKDRGESFSYLTQENESLYWLTEEEALPKLKELKEKMITDIEYEILQLQNIVDEIQK